MRVSAAPRSAAKELKMRVREFASCAINSAASSQQEPAQFDGMPWSAIEKGTVVHARGQQGDDGEDGPFGE